MQPHVQRALLAIDAAERAEAEQPPVILSAQYVADLEALRALPQNQEGADKSHVWPAYEFCRRHFADVRPS